MIDYKPKQCSLCGSTFKPIARGTKHCHPHCYIASKVTARALDDCWMWPNTKGTPDCYGFANYAGKQSVSSRFAYENIKGLIPQGQVVRHTCDRPGCVNPDHLEVGTYVDNERDKYERGRAPIGVKHHHSISVELAQAISTALGTVNAISKRFGVDYSTVKNVKSGNHWSQRIS